MREKYLNKEFGVCPRVFCSGHKLIPIGLSDHLKHSKVKLFCNKCQECYISKKKLEDIDGAYYGMNFPHVFFKNFPDIDENKNNEKINSYTPTISGFKLLGKRGSEFEGKTIDDLLIK